MQNPGAIGDLATVEATRKPNVRDHQIDAFAGLQDRERRRSVLGVEDTIVLFGQHLRNQHADVRLVVDDEDCLAKAAFHGGLCLSRVIVDHTRVPWKVDTHRGALADFRIGPDLPAGLPDEPVDHRKAEASPFSERLSREERIERLRNDVRWHSGPGVGNAQRQILSRREFALARRSIVEPFVGGLNRQTPPIRHGVARVNAQIEECALELRSVHFGRPQPRRAHDLDGDLRPHCARYQILHACDQAVDVGGPRIERLASREGQQPMRQGGGPMRRLGRCLDETVDVVEAAVLNPPLNPFQPPTDALQQIVEVVGDAPRQLPDGFHLLCLAQLILGGGERELLLTLLRDVSCRTVQGALNRRHRPG